MKINKGIKFQDDPEYKKIEDEQIVLRADREKTQTDKRMDDLLFGSGARRKPKPATETPATQPVPAKPTPPPPAPPKKEQPKVETVTKPVVPKPVPVQKPVVTKPVEESAPPRAPSGRQGFNRPAYIRKLKKIAQNFDFQTINETNHAYYQIVRPFQCDRNKIAVLQKLNSGNDGYRDKDFPLTNSSVSRNLKKEIVEWKKAEQFANKTSFGKYVQPNDIEIGRMSSPSFASILSCLAERQRNIKRLIQSQQFNPNGFYYVRVNINSVWRYINVDDFLPTIENDNVGLLSFRDSQSQISLSIIQKAYAKAFGGYDVFQKSAKPEHYLRDLTGARVSRLYLNNSSLVDDVQYALERNWTVVAVPNNRIQELGLNNQYNLSVVGFGNAGFQLRNSWGTIVQRPKINLSKEGLFQLNMQQATKYFEYILIAQTDDQLYTSTVQSKHAAGFYSSYTFRIKSPVQAIISASQWDQRLFPKQFTYIYSPFRLILDRKDDDKSEYVGGVYGHSERNIDLLVTLNPGVYTVSCIGSWNKGHTYDYSITLYGNHPVSFTKNYTENFPNIISQSLQQLNLSTGKRSAKGHVDQYILYHEPTNLVLLTNLNISDKPYDYTQDLSRINFETLNLLNAPNNEQNFGQKLEQQVSSIKQDHNSERRWSIHLEPKQAYTWVISTRENYNQNNFKVWGFK